MGAVTSAFKKVLETAGIPLPPGVNELAAGINVVGNSITSAVGKTYNIADLGVTYAIDKTGNVVDIVERNITFIMDPVTKEVFKGADVVFSYSGLPISARDILPGGRFFTAFQQLAKVGTMQQQIVASLEQIVSGTGSIVDELNSW